MVYPGSRMVYTDQEWYTQKIRNGIHKDQEWYTRIRNGIHIIWYFDNGERRSAIVKIFLQQSISALH